MSSKWPIPATHQHKPIPKGSLSHCSKSHSLLHLQEVKTTMETHALNQRTLKYQSSSVTPIVKNSQDSAARNTYFSLLFPCTFVSIFCGPPILSSSGCEVQLSSSPLTCGESLSTVPVPKQ